MVSGLDDIDQRIISELRRNGRQANTEIARRTGVSEATVRNRIQRLVGEGVIQVAAVTNLPRLGYETDVVIGVQCETGRVLDVARRFALMEEVRFASCVSGRYDLLVVACFRSRDELFDFLTVRIAGIPGIDRTETMHQLRVVKRDYDYWESPLTEQVEPEEVDDGRHNGHIETNVPPTIHQGDRSGRGRIGDRRLRTRRAAEPDRGTRGAEADDGAGTDHRSGCSADGRADGGTEAGGDDRTGGRGNGRPGRG